MDVKALVPILIQGSMFLVVLAFAMQCRWSDFVATLHRPGLLFRAFLAINVVVPLVALAIVYFFPLERVVEVGLILMAVSPLAPLAPGNALKAGSARGSVIGAYTVMIVLAIVIVPLTVHLVDGVFGAQAVVPLPLVARVILISAVIPIAIGLMIGAAAPDFSSRVAPLVTKAAFAVLALLLILVVGVAHAQFIELIGNGTLLAFTATIAMGLAAGHLLGGPDWGGRGGLAIAAATRHPGIAGAIAHANQADQRAVVATLLFLLNGVIVAAIYQHWLKRRASRDGDPSATPPSSG